MPTKPDDIWRKPADPRRARRLFISLVALAAFWFLGVDWAWTVENCYDCGTTVDVSQYRLFGVPIVSDRREHQSLTQKVASDFGAPCPHQFRKSTRLKHRWWGLVICACPCQNGLDALVGEIPDYDTVVVPRIKEWLARDPSIGIAYRTAMEDDDREFIRTVNEQLGVWKKSEVSPPAETN